MYNVMLECAHYGNEWSHSTIGKDLNRVDICAAEFVTIIDTFIIIEVASVHCCHNLFFSL